MDHPDHPDHPNFAYDSPPLPPCFLESGSEESSSNAEASSVPASLADMERWSMFRPIVAVALLDAQEPRHGDLCSSGRLSQGSVLRARPEALSHLIEALESGEERAMVFG